MSIILIHLKERKGDLPSVEGLPSFTENKKVLFWLFQTGESEPSSSSVTVGMLSSQIEEDCNKLNYDLHLKKHKIYVLLPDLHLQQYEIWSHPGWMIPFQGTPWAGQRVTAGLDPSPQYYWLMKPDLTQKSNQVEPPRQVQVNRHHRFAGLRRHCWRRQQQHRPGIHWRFGRSNSRTGPCCQK